MFLFTLVGRARLFFHNCRQVWYAKCLAILKKNHSLNSKLTTLLITGYGWGFFFFYHQAAESLSLDKRCHVHMLSHKSQIPTLLKHILTPSPILQPRTTHLRLNKPPTKKTFFTFSDKSLVKASPKAQPTLKRQNHRSRSISLLHTKRL